MAIEIKKKNKGLLHKIMGIAKGKKIPEKALAKEKSKATKSGNTAEKKRVVFAENAKKWNKGKKRGK